MLAKIKTATADNQNRKCIKDFHANKQNYTDDFIQIKSFRFFATSKVDPPQSSAHDDGDNENEIKTCFSPASSIEIDDDDDKGYT